MDLDPAPARRVAVIGDRTEGHEAQDAIAPALAHAAAALGRPAPVVHWVPTEDLAGGDAAARLAEADAVWCAPGGPYRSLDGALAGIRYAREHRVPFVGTCAGFQHAVIEVARHLAGLPAAQHAEYGHEGGDLVIDVLACSIAGRRMVVDLVDPDLVALYGATAAEERYYCRFGVNPVHRPALEAAGLAVAGVDPADGQPRIMRLAHHPYFVITLFVPQVSSTPDRPHPLVRGLLAAAGAPAGLGVTPG
jgi:CTP synthase (UTP-ammonia lyase)